LIDTFKIATISFANYFIGLSELHEILQIGVALLSIILLIMNIKKEK
tara:strand:- start:115 stop:255 length:141 start_codon:yes stop_codon:yes gene_type:complete